MELLATIDWLVEHDEPPTLEGMEAGLSRWPGGADAGARKVRLFDDRMIEIALDRLCTTQDETHSPWSRDPSTRDARPGTALRRGSE